MVVFTGILSVIFLKRKLKPYHWFSMLLVLAGAAIVGSATQVCKSSDSGGSNPALGNALIVAAQVIVAVQMVVEEKLLGSYDIPALQAVGWEGFWVRAPQAVARPGLGRAHSCLPPLCTPRVPGAC